MPIYNPLDPLGSIGAIFWYLVEQLNNFVSNGLNNPEAMMGTVATAQWLFEENWGLISYLTLNFVVLVIGAIALGWTHGMKYLPKAVIFAAIFGTGGGAVFWNVNTAFLKWSRDISRDVSGLDMGQAAAIQSNAMPFQKLDGPWQFVYGLDLFFLFIQAFLLGIIVLSQFVVSWLFIVTVGCYPMGETGRMIGRIGLAAWLVSIVLALPTMALLRRAGMVASHGAQEPWARLITYGFTLLMLFMISLYIVIANVGLTRIAGGRLSSEIENGHVTTDSEGGGNNSGGSDSEASGSDSVQPIAPPDEGPPVGLEDQVGYLSGDQPSSADSVTEGPGSLTVDGLTIDTEDPGSAPEDTSPALSQSGSGDGTVLNESASQETNEVSPTSGEAPLEDLEPPLTNDQTAPNQEEVTNDEDTHAGQL